MQCPNDGDGEQHVVVSYSITKDRLLLYECGCGYTTEPTIPITREVPKEKTYYQSCYYEIFDQYGSTVKASRVIADPELATKEATEESKKLLGKPGFKTVTFIVHNNKVSVPFYARCELSTAPKVEAV